MFSINAIQNGGTFFDDATPVFDSNIDAYVLGFNTGDAPAVFNLTTFTSGNNIEECLLTVESDPSGTFSGYNAVISTDDPDDPTDSLVFLAPVSAGKNIVQGIVEYQTGQLYFDNPTGGLSTGFVSGGDLRAPRTAPQGWYFQAVAVFS